MPPKHPTPGSRSVPGHCRRSFIAAAITTCLIAASVSARAQSAPGELELTYAAVPAAASGVAFMASTPGGPLLVGYAGLNQVHRFDAAGQVDGDYQSDPGADGAIVAAALQSSGKLLVAGHFTQFHGSPARGIVRLNPDGSVDDEFSDVEAEGYPIIPELVTLPDDRILIAYAPGELTGFLRLLPDGAIDPTYDRHGFHSFAPFRSTRLAPDASFYTISETSVARVLEGGLADEFFGLAEPNGPRALAVQGDGKLIVGGYHQRYYPEQGFLRTASLTRVLADGLDDPDFEPDGVFGDGDGSSVQQVDTEPGGRIIASGSFRNYGGIGVPGLLRFWPDGRRDRNFDASAAIPPTSEVLHHELMPDGQICLALRSAGGEIEILRLHGGDPAPLAPSIVAPPTDKHGLLHRTATFEVIADGFPDPVYQWRKAGVDIPGEAGRDLVLEPLSLADAGRYSVQVSNSQGSIISAEATLTVSQAAPGQLDYSFVPELSRGTVKQLELASGGKVLLGGHLLPQPDGSRRRLKQLNPDGSTDQSFGDAPDVDFFTVNSMLVEPDGKILTGGTYVFVERRLPDGRLDPDFQIPDVCCEEPDARFLGRQSDGKILVYGRTFQIFEPADRAGLIRLLPGGGLDTSFLQNAYSGPLLVAGDDRIYAQGNNAASSGLVRMLPDGQDDLSFAASVDPRANLRQIVEQADGKLILVYPGSLRRLNADGSDDPSFVPELDGIDSAIHVAALEPSGKILIGGSFRNLGGLPRRKIARLYPDGALDLSFESGSMADASGRIDQIEIQEDGQILISGEFSEIEGQPRHAVARLQGGDAAPQAPSVDVPPTGGSVSPGEAFQLSVLSSAHPRPSYQWRIDGRDIIGATGHTLDLETTGLADAGRYTVVITNALGSIETEPVTLWIAHHGFATGELDLSFDAGEIRQLGNEAQVLDILPRGDGDILIAGRFQSVAGFPQQNLARLSGLGVVDPSFPTVDTNRLTTLLGQPQDTFYAAGYLKLERRFADGAPDPAWDPANGSIAGEVRALVQQPDGKIIAGGDFDEVDLNPVNGLVRFHPDRSLDASFSHELQLDDEIDALALQADGRLLVGGEFGLVRLLGDGTPDPSFQVDLGIGGVEAILVLEDGGTIIAGDFSSVDGVGIGRIARLDADGALDPSFAPEPPLAGGQLKALAIGPDSHILAAGEELAAGGEPLGTLVRFSQSGQRDPDLQISLAGGDSEIRTLALQADGRLLIGGEFTSVNGTRREQIARLFIDPVPVLSFVDGDARYRIPSVPGRHYALQASPDLAGPWLEVDSATGDGSILTLREPIPPASQSRYFRVEITRPDLR